MTRWEPMLLELGSQRRGRLLSFATMLAGPSEADDLVQDAVIAVFSKHRGFESVAQAEQYVRRAIATRFIDGTRKRAAERERMRRTAVPEAVADHAERVATGEALDDALATLAPRVRACVVLRFVEDMSIRETAHVLGLSEGAVKRYVSDGLKALNTTLGTREALGEVEAAPVTANGGAR
ncbi:RNA polymerase sigma factor [Demequina maris]|uniref:RNA polymerase sigma factor n=1 Tax=Demequina maris TaxID=1638982 RepID=UPI0009E45AE6|nr:sigma-70 family RNA polymerase sigma factor [Demequina maris]